MRGVIHKFSSDIYRTDFTVCFDRNTFTRKYYQDATVDFAGCCVFKAEDSSINIYLKKHDESISVPDCAHESYHAADFVFDRCGIEYKEESGNEHMAYLIGWITHKIFDCLEFDNKLRNNS